MTTLRGFGFTILVLAGAGGLAQAQAPNLREMFQRLDANGDMVIERSEVPANAIPGFEKLLKAADANKDGKIEADEMRAMTANLPAAKGAGAGDIAARFKALDKNGDGKVSKDEFPPAGADRFALMDADKNGVLELKELQAFAQKNAGGAGAANMAPAARILAMDKDGDGKVSKTEFQGQPVMFDRMDTDKDGFLSKTEAAQGATAMFDRMKAMDADGDGKISKTEFQGRPDVFTRLDGNKDGFLTMEEIRDAKPEGTPATKAAAKKAAKKKANP